MLAFQEKDVEFFFGRQRFVDGLVRVVQQQPLVAVIGSSGSGKSSLVLAGLIPKLREEGSWLIESFRPNKQPFYELAAALISQLEPELGKTDKTIKAKELTESIRQHGFTADVSAILKDKPGKRLLLVVDQFEELYTGCAYTEQQQFVDALLAAVESASPRLTQKQSRGLLTHQAYSEIGGVAKALSNHAEAVYGKLSEQEQKQAQQIFLQLVYSQEETKDTRRVATRGEVGEECWELIRRTDGLADARLVVTGRNEATGEETVEVVHEALIWEWGKLQEWIENDRTFLTWRVQLRIQMAQWNADKDEGALLRGKSLVIAEDWLQKRQADLTNEWKYIESSLDLRKKEIKERESQQQRITIARTLAICFLIAFLGLVVFFFRDIIKIAFISANRKHLAGSNLAKEYLRGVDFSSGNLSQANLSGANIDGSNLSKAKLNKANLVKTYMRKARLQDADLSQANLSGADIDGSDLSRAKLNGASFIKTYMPKTQLQNTDLSQANLSEAHIDGADLSGANLQGAKNLNPDQVKRAKNWEKAKYDEEFRKKLGLK